MTDRTDHYAEAIHALNTALSIPNSIDPKSDLLLGAGVSALLAIADALRDGRTPEPAQEATGSTQGDEQGESDPPSDSSPDGALEGLLCVCGHDIRNALTATLAEPGEMLTRHVCIAEIMDTDGRFRLACAFDGVTPWDATGMLQWADGLMREGEND